MKLSIGNQPIVIPEGANISIEKSSPVLGNDSTSFSYPFPVPRIPNHFTLGWPGKLERIGEISAAAFILEDQGIQVAAGEVEFDDIDDKEIGVILKSGSTEFASKIKDLKMADIDFGSEAWFGGSATVGEISAKHYQWDAANAAENAPIIAVQFLLDNVDKTAEVLGNTWDLTQEYVAYMLQFRAWYLIEKIFEYFDYTITADYLKTSEFVQLIVFTRPFYFQFPNVQDPNDISISPILDTLSYASLMPDITIQDFLDGIKSVPGLVFLIDDQNKLVTITFQRSLFDPESIDLMPITELKGWIHREHVTTDGYQLAYQSQDDENDTKIDYIINETVADTLPSATIEGRIVHITSVDQDYITKKLAIDSSLYWSMIGRLKPVISGNGGMKIEFPVKVPPSRDIDDVLHPYLGIDPARKSGVLYLINNDMTELYVSLYRGIVSYGGTSQPLICSEKWVPQATPSLVPADLYTDVFEDYITWKTLYARSFTKYIQLTLPDLIALQWGKRYFIGGIRVVLEKINYELPWTGIVKVEGYTA